MFKGFVNPDLLKKQTSKNICGIYFLYKKNKLVYIGQSISILSRIYSHLNKKSFDSFSYIECKRERLNHLEYLYIYHLNPLLNYQTFNKYRNVWLDKSRKKKKWTVQIYIKGCPKHIGNFETAQEANVAAIRARKKYNIT